MRKEEVFQPRKAKDRGSRTNKLGISRDVNLQCNGGGSVLSKELQAKVEGTTAKRGRI